MTRVGFMMSYWVCLLASYATGQIPTFGNVLVGHSQANLLEEWTSQGQLVRTISVPQVVTSGTEYSREAAVDKNGDVFVFNGTFSPHLSVLHQASQTWHHATYPGWFTSNNSRIGAVAVMDGGVYVASQGSLPAVIRFDAQTLNGAVVLTSPGQDGYIDVAAGWDGRIYALRGNSRVDVYDPTLGLQVGTVNLGIGQIIDIAVNRSGEYFAAGSDDWIYRISPSGVLIQTLDVGVYTMYANHSDIALSGAGRVALVSTLLVTCDESFQDVYIIPGIQFPDTVTFRSPLDVPSIGRVRLIPGSPPNPIALRAPSHPLLPFLGASWELYVAPFLPGVTHDVIGIGIYSGTSVSTPIGTQLLRLEDVFFTWVGAAGATLAFEIPFAPELLATSFTVQALSVSPSGCALTNAIDVDFGTIPILFP